MSNNNEWRGKQLPTEQLFEKYAKEGENMEALKALKMLTKAYIKDFKIELEWELSKEIRTSVYSAAEVWLYDRLPKQDNNPFTEEEINGTLAELMPRIYKRYGFQFYGSMTICGGLSPQQIKERCLFTIKEKLYGSETLSAFCWAVNQIPDLYWKWNQEEIHHVAFLRPYIHGNYSPRIVF